MNTPQNKFGLQSKVRHVLRSGIAAYSLRVGIQQLPLHFSNTSPSFRTLPVLRRRPEEPEGPQHLRGALLPWADGDGGEAALPGNHDVLQVKQFEIVFKFSS